VKVPAGIHTVPDGAQRSLAVPSGAVAQKAEAHWLFVVQAVPRAPPVEAAVLNPRSPALVTLVAPGALTTAR
jgi:hypothetical protein